MAFQPPVPSRPASPRVPGPRRLLLPILVLAVFALTGGCGRVAPRYEPATLTVTSTPPGAAIQLDGRDTGQVTPHTFTGLSPDAHEVSVSLPEWHADPASIPVELSPLEDAEVGFTLFQTGLRVTSEPPGARILVDGVDTGKLTPAVVAGLEPGPVDVSLELETWLCVPGSLQVEVVEGSVVDVPAEDLRLRSRRTVLLESFGNVNCATCAQAAENLVAVTGAGGFGPDRALFIEFSVNWPSPVDPFYLANPTENADRYMYYWVLGAPAIYLNGQLQAHPLDADSTAAAVAGRWATDPGFVLDVAATLEAGSTVPVAVTVTPLASVDLSGCVLYVALYENVIAYDTPPGNNGQTVFHHIFRDRIDTPPALGALSAGQPQVFDLTLSRGAVAPDNATVVAFVQRTADRVVLQAGSTLGPVPLATALTKGAR